MPEIKENTTLFAFTEDQQETVCRHFGKDPSKMEFWEICELLDKVIDNLD